MPIAEKLLDELDADWRENESRKDTPKRFAKALVEWFTPIEFKFTTFKPHDAARKQLVVVKDISFNSFCEHHIAAIIGKVKISYAINEKMAGLSKFGRVVEAFSKDLMVQEDFTAKIFDFLQENLEPLYLKVEVDAIHTCMTSRGVKKDNASTYTCLEGERQS